MCHHDGSVGSWYPTGWVELITLKGGPLQLAEIHARSEQHVTCPHVRPGPVHLVSHKTFGHRFIQEAML